MTSPVCPAGVTIQSTIWCVSSVGTQEHNQWHGLYVQQVLQHSQQYGLHLQLVNKKIIASFASPAGIQEHTHVVYLQLVNKNIINMVVCFSGWYTGT